MQATIPTAAPNAHQWLRQFTAAAHARIDVAVGGGLHTTGAYTVYLRGMHRFVVESQRVLPTVDALAARRAWLEADLSSLRRSPLATVRTESVDLHPAAQLGWEYVLAGAAIGARYLLRDAKALGYSADAGARFLAGHAAANDWPDYLARLERATLSDLDRQIMGDAALAAFAAVHAALTAAKQMPDHE